MPLTGRQRRDLLRIERTAMPRTSSRRSTKCWPVIRRPTLLDIEMVFRAAACAGGLSGSRRCWLSCRDRNASLGRRTRPARPNAGTEPAGVGRCPLTSRTIGCRSRRPPRSAWPHVPVHTSNRAAPSPQVDLGLDRIDLNQTSLRSGLPSVSCSVYVDRGHHCRPSLSPAIKRIAASKSPNRIG